MSEYSTLYIAKASIDDYRNSIGYGAILFTENDVIVTPMPYYEEISESVEDNTDEKHCEDSDESQTRGHRFQVSAASMVDRLEIMGYTAERTKKAFVEGISALREHYDCYRLQTSQQEASIFDDFDYELWSSLMKRILDERLIRIYSREEALEKDNPQLHYMLGGNYYDNPSLFGFPCEDPCFAYRAILALVNKDEPVVLDFSSLVVWTRPETYKCSPPKIIILTEGASDKWLLEETLHLLYPHLSEYYSFADFISFNMPGSSGHLVTVVKAFLGTGITIPILALFDNDTAGRDALRQLEKLKFPDSMKAFSLPDLDSARTYPTIGPTGNVTMDVNGLAGSIELYLGKNVLVSADGHLTPVQWTGYVQGMRQYQGEIQNKIDIQNRYRQLLSNIDTGKTNVKDHDWSGMELILKNIFSAFN